MRRWETDSDLDDDEWPEDDADEGSMDCPYCGESMYDDSIHCPACGRYLSSEDGGDAKQPKWVLITAIALLIIMLSGLTIFF